MVQHHVCKRSLKDLLGVSLLVLPPLLFELRLERHLGTHLLAALPQKRLPLLELRLQLLELLKQLINKEEEHMLIYYPTFLI